MKSQRTSLDVDGVLATGRELVVHESLALPDFNGFRFPEPIAVDVVVRRLGRGLEVRGILAGEVTGDCARCLGEVQRPLRLDLDERFSGAGETTPLGENNVLAGGELDLSDLVRQSIDSALPIVLLCNEACTGLCPECGYKRDGNCRCAHPE